MSNNSNPVDGTGTATADADDDGFEAYLAESEGMTGDDEQDGPDPGDDGETLQADEAEGDAEAGEDSEKGIGDDVLVKLADGTEVPIKELRDGFLRNNDYTRKTQALAEETRKVEATRADLSEQAERIEAHKQALERSYDVVIKTMASMLPPEPDHSLAYTDPQSFMQQRALFDAQMQRITQIVGERDAATAEIAKSEAQVLQKQAAIEARKIEAAFPEVKGGPEKARAFLSTVYSQAETLGISREEMNGVTDSRILIGLAKLARFETAERARKEAAAKGKVQIATRPNPGAPRAPSAGENAAAVKAVQAFRKQPMNAAAARNAIDSGAFDAFLK